MLQYKRPGFGLGKSSYKEHAMNTMLLKMYVKAQNLKDLLKSDEGQDLVEYALLVALISLAAITTVGEIAKQIESIFESISTSLAGVPTSGTGK